MAVPAPARPAVAERAPVAAAPEPAAAEAQVAPSRVLVVANETVGSEQLLEELRRIPNRTKAKYLVLVPAQVIHTGGGPVWSEESVRAAAQRRLNGTMEVLRSEGLEVEGVVGDYRPVQAIELASAVFKPDLVVISTHPPGRSRWLRENIVERARQRVKVPVRHVVSYVPAEAMPV
jgi:GABA permease